MGLAINFRSILIIVIILHSVTCETICRADETKHITMLKNLEDNKLLGSKNVKRIMYLVDRGCFLQTNPYEIGSRSIDFGGTILAPQVQARILKLLSFRLRNGFNALVVDPGSGYLTACVSIMTGISGVTIAALPNGDLTKLASKNVENWLNHDNRGHYLGLQLGKQIEFPSDDIQKAWSKRAPYNGIFVRTTDKSVVDKLKRLLKPGGRLVVLEGHDGGKQFLYRFDCLSFGLYQRSHAIIFEDVSSPDKQQPKEPVLPSTLKPTEGNTSQESIDVPSEATLDEYREENIGGYDTEEDFFEYGISVKVDNDTTDMDQLTIQPLQLILIRIMYTFIL
uniref:protein-L-isoaspartate(D-aspartate) O-methyltransferase n=2 Tax=Trichobilharzia regenti TaxID=157069 RepID=A0AA85IXG7_TRIRE|nr:unnamed protein product [Trichobilharzia regenti]